MNVYVCLLAAVAAIFCWLFWSVFRSRFEAGRRRGIEEAVREIQVGFKSILDLEFPSPEIAKAQKELSDGIGRWSPRRFGTDPLHAHIWRLGAALGDTCWAKGHAAGIQTKAPIEGRIRVDLSLVDLLQLGGLANLGFQHMMPNARQLQVQRFTSEDDALEAARAITKIESAIPKDHRPDLLRQAADREQLVVDWWQPNSGMIVA